MSESDSLITNDQQSYCECLSCCNCQPCHSLTVCCHMCSCCNDRGIWYTKFGKFIFRMPCILIITVIIACLLMLFGVGTTSLVYTGYDVTTGCPIDTVNCTDTTMCNANDQNALLFGCAFIGLISVFVVITVMIIILCITGTLFYCLDTCCSEIGKSYRYSEFTLYRDNHHIQEVV
jgi:hypothetical protein